MFLSVKDPRSKIAFPDFRSGLVLGLFTFKQNSLRVPKLRRAGGGEITLLAELGLVSRGATAF
ncbi:hypothetical protein AUI06_01405 [archaeon 13_2_20CM_2_52_21]|nr:MAG: hypothetical protein AUI06_01405 [archaeon 13_2_20CM_2_52_21]OLD09430.1 MAG: hypothetical protein AUI95_00925 [Crenarchaeota archaeon 13_1_40CM_3_52_4]